MTHDQSQNSIVVDNLSFGYSSKELVLKNISLNIHPGDYLGIIGPNGGGKTTLLKIMLGLLKPTSGQVKLFGVPLSDFKDWSKIGYVPQKATQLEQRFPASVAEVVRFGRVAAAGLFRSLGPADDTAVTDALKKVDMLPYRDTLIGDLSGGQQQRVLIARALVSNPSIIFLDEPTVGVDLKNQEQFYALLKRLNQELGVTLVMVSHDIDVVANEGTELACINQELSYHGAPQAFFTDDYLKKLYGKETKLILHGHGH